MVCISYAILLTHLYWLCNNVHATHIHTHTHAHTFTCICTHTDTHTHAHTFTYICTHTGKNRQRVRKHEKLQQRQEV